MLGAIMIYLKIRNRDSESRLGGAQTRMRGIRGFPLPKGNRDADKRGFVIAYLRSFAFICGF